MNANAATSTSRTTGTRIPMNKPREGSSKLGTGLSFDLLNYEKKKKTQRISIEWVLGYRE